MTRKTFALSVGTNKLDDLSDKDLRVIQEILDSIPCLSAQVRNMQLKEARRLLAINEARQDKGV